VHADEFHPKCEAVEGPIHTSGSQGQGWPKAKQENKESLGKSSRNAEAGNLIIKKYLSLPYKNEMEPKDFLGGCGVWPG
jgi:hypothetical protein